MLQLIDLERFPLDRVSPPDRKTHVPEQLNDFSGILDIGYIRCLAF